MTFYEIAFVGEKPRKKGGRGGRPTVPQGGGKKIDQSPAPGRETEKKKKRRGLLPRRSGRGEGDRCHPRPLGGRGGKGEEKKKEKRPIFRREEQAGSQQLKTERGERGKKRRKRFTFRTGRERDPILINSIKGDGKKKGKGGGGGRGIRFSSKRKRHDLQLSFVKGKGEKKRKKKKRGKGCALLSESGLPGRSNLESPFSSTG